LAVIVFCVADEQKSAVNKALGDEVRVWRTRRGLSRAGLSALTRELAPETPLTPTQIERIENNKRDMSLSQLFLISLALKVDPERIVRDAVDANGGVEALIEGAQSA
jgi:transcriptional regulator with XRE-family HTH domain